MQLIVHPGIGDISWVLSKLSTTGKRFDLVIAQDSKTRRSMPLAKMVPCIQSAEYGGMELYGPLARCGNAKFVEYERAEKAGKKLYMTANNWLEAGNRIEGYLPDLATDYHYPLYIPQQDIEWADKVVGDSDCAVGIYTAGAAGIAVWRAWSEWEWLDFICRIRTEWPHVTFFLFGAQWDMDIRAPMADALSQARVNYVDLIGKTTLQQAVALIQRVDYFAGYASGLTILADVVRTPCLMLYPDHLTKMMTAWPDPVHLADGTHIGAVWDRPIKIFGRVQKQLSKHLGECQ